MGVLEWLAVWVCVSLVAGVLLGGWSIASGKE